MYSLSLDWSHSKTEIIGIEDHITNRMDKSKRRKSADPKKRGRQAFRLDVAARVARLCNVSGLCQCDLCNMEKAKHARIRGNNHRADVGLPPLDILPQQ
jgi:hypothetical protein